MSKGSLQSSDSHCKEEQETKQKPIKIIISDLIKSHNVI
jgi:hypothetical protein